MLEPFHGPESSILLKNAYDVKYKKKYPENEFFGLTHFVCLVFLYFVCFVSGVFLLVYFWELYICAYTISLPRVYVYECTAS